MLRPSFRCFAASALPSYCSFESASLDPCVAQHANGPVKASYMGKPLMRTEYTLYSTKRQPKIRRKLKKKK